MLCKSQISPRNSLMLFIFLLTSYQLIYLHCHRPEDDNCCENLKPEHFSNFPASIDVVSYRYYRIGNVYSWCTTFHEKLTKLVKKFNICLGPESAILCPQSPPSIHPPLDPIQASLGAHFGLYTIR
jgi:hypothetical protein